MIDLPPDSQVAVCEIARADRFEVFPGTTLAIDQIQQVIAGIIGRNCEDAIQNVWLRITTEGIGELAEIVTVAQEENRRERYRRYFARPMLSLEAPLSLESRTRWQDVIASPDPERPEEYESRTYHLPIIVGRRGLSPSGDRGMRPDLLPE